MSFTGFDILAWTIAYLQVFVIAKIIIRDKALHLKEAVYIVGASLFLTFLVVISISVFHVGGTISTAAASLLVMIYFYKIKSYPAKKTSPLTFISILIVALSDLFIMAVANVFFPSFLLSIPNFPLPIGLSLNHFLRFISYILCTYVFSILITFQFVKATKKQRSLINQSNNAQAVLAVGSSLGIVVSVVWANIWRHFGTIVGILAIAPFGIAAVGLAGIVLYARRLEEKIKKSEQEALQHYTRQVEEQQGIVTKIQHDIGNILSSIEGYLENDDLPGLKTYFHSKIKVTTAAITSNNPTLARLANIKVPEIKATLAGKLLVAQSAGIDTTFEATDEIDHIPVDSVALVRMLGIILDNAIEELTELGAGYLMVACWKANNGLTFVVQNTCRADIPKLHELKVAGFSTKGEGRGLGLNNLTEIAAAYPDNISLQTDIKDGHFIQKLRIGGAE